jgi:AcrR family transcriptional regulator
VRFGHFRNQLQGGGKRERTRAALLDATLRVVAEKGMEALKISDITATADLANGTFYNHFEDKDEILREAAYGIAFAISSQLDNEMEAITDAPTRVVTATRNFINIVLEKPDWAAVMLDSAAHMPNLQENVAQYLRADLQLGVAQGKFDIEVTPFLLLQFIALISVAVTVQLKNGITPQLTAETCENVLRLLGFSPSKARKTVAATLARA